MKRFMTRHLYLMFTISMSMFLLAGCGGGAAGDKIGKVTALSTLNNAGNSTQLNNAGSLVNHTGATLNNTGDATVTLATGGTLTNNGTFNNAIAINYSVGSLVFNGGSFAGTGDFNNSAAQL